MIQLFKAKSLKNTNFLNSNRNERTQEKAILKEGIGTSREATCTRGGRTRGNISSLNKVILKGKMISDFWAKCTGSYTSRKSGGQMPFKSNLSPSKMGFAVQGTKGRSMVEMLGVLAIIGVLSIGGIQGYTMAMRRYRANEILNALNKYAITYYSACQTGMMNDPEHYYIVENCRDIGRTGKNCWICNDSIKFTDAGLGEMPLGLKDIYGIEIRSLDSGDAIIMSINLDDKPLCETIATITARDMSISHQEQGFCTGSQTYGYGLNFVTFMEN